jgi:nucleosome assembly protein 1-like 1
MVQDRLGDLVGRSSGYIESLPLPVRRRIIALKGLQQSHQAVEAEFQIAIFELEKSFLKKFEPIYTRRKELIAGGSEPKSEEIEEGEKVEDREEEEERDEEDEDEDEDEEREPREHSTAPTAAELSSAPKGIPEFWLTSLKNHLGLSELITERDEEALKHLIDLRISYPDTKPGFILTFEFGKDAKKFFKNNVLVKTYYYQDVVGEEGDFVYDRAEGTKIDWVEGKDLTTRVETKKQRNKSKSSFRVCALITLIQKRIFRHQPNSNRQKGGSYRFVLLILFTSSASF